MSQWLNISFAHYFGISPRKRQYYDDHEGPYRVFIYLIYPTFSLNDFEDGVLPESISESAEYEIERNR